MTTTTFDSRSLNTHTQTRASTDRQRTLLFIGSHLYGVQATRYIWIGGIRYIPTHTHIHIHFFYILLFSLFAVRILFFPCYKWAHETLCKSVFLSFAIDLLNTRNGCVVFFFHLLLLLSSFFFLSFLCARRIQIRMIHFVIIYLCNVMLCI